MKIREQVAMEYHEEAETTVKTNSLLETVSYQTPILPTDQTMNISARGKRDVRISRFQPATDRFWENVNIMPVTFFCMYCDREFP